MTATGSGLGEGFYRPKRLKPCLVALAFFLLAAVIADRPLHDFASWLEGGAWPSGGAIFALLGALLIFALGALALANATLGLPRLALTEDGIEIDTLFGTKWANWNSVAIFELTAVYAGFLRRRLSLASSVITGPAVSGNLARKKKIAIPDAFEAPMARIVEELNARRSHALGLAYDFTHVAASPAEERKFGAAGANVPWLSFLILAVLAAVFAAEQIYAVGPVGPALRPSIATLQALGGVSRNLVLWQGEWYRLFTAPLLHGDLSHIFFNGIALVLAGFLLERLVGRAWFLAFFVIGGLGGSVMSILVNPAAMISVGASGAIMGLLAAAYVSSFRLPPGTKARWAIQLGAARLLVPALLPLATSGGSHIDYGAHLGGTLSGALVAFLLLRNWSDTERLPGSRHIATGIAVAAMIAFAASSIAIVQTYPRYGLLAGLIPESQFPKDQAEGQERAAELVEHYPQDPRSHYYRGAALAKARDYPAAEQQLRTAVSQAEHLRFFFGPRIPNAMRAVLAAVQLEEGKEADARETAQPLCDAPANAAPPASLRRLLVGQHLCAL